MAQKKVIEIGAPGLGDSLSYSTLPEELTKQFGYEVWIHGPRDGWRNAEVQRLWERNPFVAGFTAEPRDVFPPYEDRPAASYPSWIMAMENAYGCKPTNASPKIYWRAQRRLCWNDKIFLDPRSSSQPFPGPVVDEYVRNLGRQMGFDPASVLVVESPFSGQYGRDAMPNNPRVAIDGLDQLADAIFSSRIFLTVESGTHAFASAVKGESPTPYVFACFTCHQSNDATFHFGNVIYRLTGQLGRDYLNYG